MNQNNTLDSTLFTGIIFNKNIHINTLIQTIETSFNLKISGTSEIFNFDHSTYYCSEMGTNLKRIFVSFDSLIDPLKGPKFKLIAQTIEKRYQHDNKRNANIDPGLLSLHNLILYSTKNYAHRISCIQGVYADLTYIFSKKNIQFLPWTYPDFKQQLIQDYFIVQRNSLKQKLQGPIHS